MKIFVTGGTGFIGSNLVLRLAREGHTIHALVRSPEKAGNIEHPNVKCFAGDLQDIPALEKAIEGCDQVYHLAAYARVWSKTPQTFYDINVTGTLNVLEVAQRLGVKKSLVMSTGGTLGPSPKGKEVVTEENRPTSFFNDYESTKAQCEEKVQELAANGQNVVIVNPCRLYGPGLISESNVGTIMIRSYLQGKWRVLPGFGDKIGSYVLVDDVVDGSIRAMEKGRSGERYILGGDNKSYKEYFKLLAEVSGKKVFLWPLPVFLMLAFAQVQMMRTWFGGSPLITTKWALRFMHHWVVSSDKAKTELGYNPRSLKEGMEITVDWLRKEVL